MKLFSSSSALVLGTIENMFLSLILATVTPMGGGTTASSLKSRKAQKICRKCDIRVGVCHFVQIAAPRLMQVRLGGWHFGGE